MILLVVVLFAAVFLAVLLSVGLGTSYFRSKQKQQIRAMLQKAEATPAEQRSELLRPAEVEDSLTKLLSRFDFMDRLDLILEQAGNGWSASKLITISMILFAIGFVIGWKLAFLAAFFCAPICGFACALLPFLMVLWKRKKMLNAFEEQLPEALDFLSRSMRAGHGFSVALEMLATDSPDPLGAAFRRISNDIQLGSSLEVALKRMGTLVPLIDVRFFVSSVLLQQETGGNLGEILSKLALIIRERFRVKGQVKAASAHGRITALVLTLLPICVSVFMMLLNPQYIKGMVATDIGRYLVYGAVVGQIIGYLIIQKIVKIKV
ncbi:MAG: type II secretion system F family protein [Acidobacteriaceae bacterium]|nr:type II secretion system F family protein [Acidobacteriaceae bacterium]